jgi:hypothetical protein
MARGIGAILLTVTLHVSVTAWGQGAARDQSGTLTATPTDKNEPSWQKRFAGSYAELSTYIGSGTFYTSGYSDPYVSNALYLRPSYQLGTKYGLSLNARVYLEEEYTKPDNSTGRHFYPLDTWFYLSAKNLYTEPRSKIRISGTLRMVLPTSWESRYAHLITGVGVGGSASRAFEFGKPGADGKRWELSASLGGVFTKSIRTSPYRGLYPGDTNNCRTVAPAGASSGTGSGGQPSASEGDHCGGPLNTNFSVMSSGNLSLSRGKYSLSTTLIVINEFRYRVDDTVFKADAAVPLGRADSTWGIVAAGYQATERWSVNVGVASLQPALDSRYQHLRFPFFDFAGPNANNFTQLFVGVNGTL